MFQNRSESVSNGYGTIHHPNSMLLSSNLNIWGGCRDSGLSSFNHTHSQRIQQLLSRCVIFKEPSLSEFDAIEFESEYLGWLQRLWIELFQSHSLAAHPTTFIARCNKEPSLSVCYPHDDAILASVLDLYSATWGVSLSSFGTFLSATNKHCPFPRFKWHHPQTREVDSSVGII